MAWSRFLLGGISDAPVQRPAILEAKQSDLGWPSKIFFKTASFSGSVILGSGSVVVLVCSSYKNDSKSARFSVESGSDKLLLAFDLVLISGSADFEPRNRQSSPSLALLKLRVHEFRFPDTVSSGLDAVVSGRCFSPPFRVGNVAFLY